MRFEGRRTVHEYQDDLIEDEDLEQIVQKFHLREKNGFVHKANPPLNKVDHLALMQKRRTALFEAATRGNLEAVALLLNRGAIVDNRSGSHGSTALIAASQAGHITVVQLLLDRGASINTTDLYGRSALYWACWNGRPNIARTLLGHGASTLGVGMDRLLRFIDAIKNDKSFAQMQSIINKSRISSSAVPLNVPKARPRTDNPPRPFLVRRAASY